MPKIGLNEAARMTGRNRATIHRAMTTGRLPFTEDNRGNRQIEVEDLLRLYGRATGLPATDAQPGEARPKRNRMRNQDAQQAGIRVAQLEAEVAAGKQRIADLEARTTEQAATIADLRRRLDDSEAERREMAGKRRWWRWRRKG